MRLSRLLSMENRHFVLDIDNSPNCFDYFYVAKALSSNWINNFLSWLVNNKFLSFLNICVSSSVDYQVVTSENLCHSYVSVLYFAMTSYGLILPLIHLNHLTFQSTFLCTQPLCPL